MATPLQNTLSRTLMNGNLTINGNISVNSPNIALGADLSGALININSYVGTVATWNPNSWTTSTGIVNNLWRAVTYGTVGGIGRFVAVATGGTSGTYAMYSNNGISWTTSTGIANNNWLSVTYGTVGGIGRFVAVANGGTSGTYAMYSNDGISWTTSTGIANNNWRGVTYGIVGGIGRFVAVAYTGTSGTQAMYSLETVVAAGANSLSIGSDASFNLYYNSAAIGYGSRCTAHNQIVLGKSITTVSVPGALSKSSGTFDIIHPLDDSKRLLHSFIEGPRCDLIYRGSTTLVDGRAVVNIDQDCVEKPECQMSDGTFVALTANADCFLQNNQSFDKVHGSIENNILTIECQNPASTDVINWLIIAERKDAFIKKWGKTNVDGFLITEHYIDDTRGHVHGQISTPLLIVDASGSSDYMPSHMMPGFSIGSAASDPVVSNDPTISNDPVVIE